MAGIRVIRRLLGLQDVNADDIEDGEVLVWDADESEFVPGSGGGGSGAPTDATYITQTANDDLSAEQALGALATGILKNTTSTGVLSIAAANTDYAAAAHASRHQNGGADEISIADLDGTPTELASHLSDSAGAHAASAISIADSGNDFTATDVEGALAELQSDHETDAAALTTHEADTTNIHGITDTAALETTTGAQTKVDTHVNDATAAHAATAIAFTPAGTIAATTVQAAIEEVASEAGGGAVAAEDVTVDSTDLVGTGTDAQAVFEELDDAIANHLADSDDAHDASAISVLDSGTLLTATDVEAALAELAAARTTHLLGYPFATSAANFGTANVFAVRVFLPFRATFTKWVFSCGNATGNMDLGIYDAAGATIVREGSFAIPGTGRQTRNITGGALTLAAGEYILAIQKNNASSTFGIIGSTGNEAIAYTPVNTFPLPATLTLTVGGTGAALSLIP